MSKEPKNNNGAGDSSPKKKNSKKGESSDLISKFQGDGLSFKAKMYGTVDVKGARGDTMCQQALQSLKSAFKSSNHHKQKILIKITIDGVSLVDAASSKRLVEHKVNRISFISKDSSDSRSFAYIVGNDEGRHTLYGIKTDKPAESVLLTFRDLFQAVVQLQLRESSKGSSRSSSVSDGAEPKSAAISNTPEQKTTFPLNIPISASSESPAPNISGENPSPTDNLSVPPVDKQNTNPFDADVDAGSKVADNQQLNNVHVCDVKELSAHPPAADTPTVFNFDLLSQLPSAPSESDGKSAANTLPQDTQSPLISTNEFISSCTQGVKHVTDSTEPTTSSHAEGGGSDDSQQNKPVDNSLPTFTEESVQDEPPLDIAHMDDELTDTTNTPVVHRLHTVHSQETTADGNGSAVVEPLTANLQSDNPIVLNDSVKVDNAEIAGSVVEPDTKYEPITEKASDDLTNTDLTFSSNFGTVASDATNPWGAESAAFVDLSNSWTKFTNSAETTTHSSGNDPWADSPFTLNDEKSSSNAVKKVDAIDPFAVDSGFTLDTFNNPQSNEIISHDNACSGNDKLLPESLPDASSDLFSSSDPFQTTDPFQTSDPFQTTDPFHTPDPFQSPNPFNVADPFQTSHQLGKPDPFDSMDLFNTSQGGLSADTSQQNVPLSLINHHHTDELLADTECQLVEGVVVTSQSNNQQLVDHVHQNAVLSVDVSHSNDASVNGAHNNNDTTSDVIELQPDENNRVECNSEQSVEDAPSQTEMGQTYITNSSSIHMSDDDQKDSSEMTSSFNFAPPNCPAPTLPPEVLASLTPTPPVVCEKKGPPPAIPARRAATQDLPPVPARKLESKTTCITSAETVEHALSLSPVPSFPPPQLPLGATLTGPPKIPARRPSKISESEPTLPSV